MDGWTIALLVAFSPFLVGLACFGVVMAGWILYFALSGLCAFVVLWVDVWLLLWALLRGRGPRYVSLFDRLRERGDSA